MNETIERAIIPYVLDDTNGYRCPNGHDKVRILFVDYTERESQDTPSFLICSECTYIEQVGVGPVPDITRREETENAK